MRQRQRRSLGLSFFAWSLDDCSCAIFFFQQRPGLRQGLGRDLDIMDGAAGKHDARNIEFLLHWDTLSRMDQLADKLPFSRLNQKGWYGVNVAASALTPLRAASTSVRSSANPAEP